MSKQVKRLLTLPSDVRSKMLSTNDPDLRNEYVRTLRNKGWTLQSIAEAVGVSRERVRQIAGMPSVPVELTADFIVPEPPHHPEKQGRVLIEPDPELLARLLELQPLAQQVRSHSPRYRAEAEEYTRLLDKAHREDGVTIYRLAKRLGVTHGAIRFRLARYGYKAAVGKGKVCQPILEKNRAR